MADDLSKNLASLKIDRSAKKPPGRVWSRLGWLAALAGLGGIGAYAAPMLEAKVFKTEVALTEVTLVSPAEATVELTATGYVQADINSRIAPKVPGRVAKVHVSQGQKVEAGDLLIELDPADDRANILAAQSRVQAARAQAQSARARVAASDADLFDAEQRAERQRKLAAQGVATSAEAEDLEARASAARETLKAAKAAALAADAEANALASQVEVLRTGLQNLSLRSPIAGTVVNRPPQAGEFVGPQPAGVSVDMGGIRVADFSTLLVETDIPEGRLALVRPGGPAEIVLDAFPAVRYAGRVKEITPQVDRAKATVLVKVAFTSPPENVLPDMSARVSFLQKELDQEALKVPPKKVVPGSAVTERAGSQVVFAVDQGQVRMTPVTLGPAFGSGFELLEGPPPGTQLVNSPGAGLADGQKVKGQDID